MSIPKKFCFIGHVDSGKSTLAGHLYYKTGGISTHDFEQIRKQCLVDKAIGQLFSRILDIHEEERIRGKTHEYSVTDFSHCDRSYQIIDTPGHKSFIRELINGLSHLESSNIIGCLMLSARDGEFDSGWDRGQTKEALLISRSLGITDLVVIVNKMDTVSWDEKRYMDIVKKSESYIKNTCGFKNYKYIPVSGYEGIGLVGTQSMPSWYKGGSFLALIDSFSTVDREFKKVSVSDAKFKAKIKILQCENVVTSGYECVLHYCGKEYECEIVKIKGNKILRNNSSEDCILITSSILDQPYASNRFLLRKNQFTVGFGVLA